MSGIAYPPPTENLPIFDDSFFNVNQNVALTEAVANTLYLKFPTAQGTETFGDIFVNGNATLNCPVQINSNLLHLTGTSSIQFPDNSIQTSAYTGTSGVASSVVVAPGGNGHMYLALTQGTNGNYPILTNTPQYDADFGILSSPQFTGNLNGNASSTTNVLATVSSSNTSLPVLFGSATTGIISCLTDGGLTYNPAANLLSTTTFSGALNGNASTSSVSSQSTISSFTSNVDYYPTMSANQTGSNSLGTDGALRYNPSTNNLTSNTFTGSLIGNASSATTASSATSATTATTANVATTATVSNTANSALGNTYIPLLTSISGNLGLNTAVSNSPRYNAITGQFTAQVFVGNLSGSASDSNNAQNVSLTTGDDSVGNWYIPYSKTTANDVNRLYIDNIATPLSYNPSIGTLTASTFNGSLSGNATSANSVQVNAGGSGTVKIALVAGSGGIYPVLANIPAYNTATATIECNNFSASGNMQAPIIQTTANGVIRTYDTGGVLATSLQQIGTDLNIIIPGTGEMKITTQGTGAIPTSNADAGTSFLWNVSAAGGESCLVNYQDGGTTGGFDFYNVNGSNPSIKIASIPKTQSAFSTASSTILATYNWVNGTVSAAIGAIPSLTSFNMTVIPPAASNTYYGLWANSATTGSHPINNGSYVQLVPNTNTITLTTNLNVLNTQTSLNNVRMQSTPIILCFGNCDGSASGGSDALNLTSSYISSTGWTNPSGGTYTITLTGVAHSIFSATITGNPGTATAGQRPQILTSVAYAGGSLNAYLSATFTIYYLQGTGGGGAPFNGAFSYSISGIIN